MITLVEGMIGSGKTYYVVQDVLKRYFTFNDDTLSWEVSKEMDVAVYSNVDGIKIGHDLMESIRLAGGLNPFFTVDYQKSFTKDKKHIYILDEAQSPYLFHRKYYDAEVFYFFQYHRHVGVDIYLITQDVTSLAKELQTINEFHIRAVRRSYTYMKEFRYNFMVGKDILKRRTLKKDLRVFSAYRSSSIMGDQSAKSFTGRYYLYVACLILLTVVGGYYFLRYRFFSRGGVERVVSNVSVPVKREVRIIGVSGEYVYVSDNGLKKVSVNNVVGDVKVGATVGVK